VPVQVLQLTA